MKAAGVVLVVVGCFLLAATGTRAPEYPSIGPVLAAFLPGLLCLIAGFGLVQAGSRAAEPLNRGDDGKQTKHTEGTFAGLPEYPSVRIGHPRGDEFQLPALLGIVSGFLLVFLSNGVASKTEGGLVHRVLLLAAGFACEVWGCVNYARRKGLSGFLGLLGYVFLPGVILLACLPNRRRRSFEKYDLGLEDDSQALARDDQRPGYRYLLTLAPLVLALAAAGFFISTSHAGIDPAEWQEFAPAGDGFRVLMPGRPSYDKSNEETPFGPLELLLCTVEPEGRHEQFRIVSYRIPQRLARRQGADKLMLEFARKELISIYDGKVKSEKPVVIGDRDGLELEILPSKGAILKARIIWAKDRVYTAVVHVPIIRVASDDVQKFLDSFEVVSEGATAKGK
jgi:hypothetical protein